MNDHQKWLIMREANQDRSINLIGWVFWLSMFALLLVVMAIVA